MSRNGEGNREEVIFKQLRTLWPLNVTIIIVVLTLLKHIWLSLFVGKKNYFYCSQATDKTINDVFIKLYGEKISALRMTFLFDI